MVCTRCLATNGTAHSFECVGTLKDSKTHLFYTCPSLATDREDSPEAVSYYVEHFKEAGPNPWIWIFDCKGMKSKDLLKSGIGKKISEIVQTNYFDNLNGIYIVNPNLAMKALVSFICPFLRKETKAKIHLCNYGLIDIVIKLETVGVKNPELSILTQKISK